MTLWPTGRLGADHVDVFSSRINLGNCHNHMGNYELAQLAVGRRVIQAPLSAYHISYGESQMNYTKRRLNDL